MIPVDYDLDSILRPLHQPKHKIIDNRKPGPDNAGFPWIEGRLVYFWRYKFAGPNPSS